MIVTALACGRSSSCCGAAGCASRRRSRSASAISTRGAGRYSCAVAKVAGVARSAWTAGAGSSCSPGSTPALSYRSGRCSASSTDQREAGRGRAPASGSSSVGSPPKRACGGGSRRTSCATPTRSSSPRRRAAQRHPAPARPRQPRHDLDLSPRDRHRRDHRHRARQARTDDVRHRRTPALINPSPNSGGGAHAPAGRTCWPPPRDPMRAPRRVDQARRSRPDVVRNDQAAVGQWRDCIVTKGAAGWLR
jgi:hypothetical protein